MSVDARAEYIEEVSRRFPGPAAHVMDMEHWEPSSAGTFDLVFCFGLLYHVANPAQLLAAYRRLAPDLYLETIVTDSAEPVCPLVAETGPDQAWSGQGCRPSLVLRG